jgi:SAM-dependent methyltransferase
VRVWRKVNGYGQTLARAEMRLREIRCGAVVRLHLGCGDKYLDGYVNVDAYSPKADVKADICELAEFDDASVDLIETHHVLEHLSFEEANNALNIWSRKLKPRGYLIISVPDLDACCRLWLTTPEDARFGKGSISQMIFGSQEHAGMYHKSGYTPSSLVTQLLHSDLDPEEVWIGYPQRPTPSFMVITRRRA